MSSLSQFKELILPEKKDKYGVDIVNKNNIKIDAELHKLDTQLQIDGESVYLDYQDGKYGINTDPNRGADTFSPFRNDENNDNESNNGSGGDLDLSKLNFGSVNFSIYSSDTSTTIDLSQYTDKYHSLYMNQGIFVVVNTVSLKSKTSLNNNNGYSQSFNVLYSTAIGDSMYNRETGILTIRSSISFNGGCYGTVYYLV